MYELIWIACLSFLFVVAEPMILLKRWIGFKEEEIGYKGKWHAFFGKLLYCTLCSGFWIGLTITFDISKAVIIAVIAELIYKINSRL